MVSVRRFQIDELALRPGTYFNPETEIMIIVDDSPEVDHEIFESVELEPTDWVLIGEDTPLDEHRRDDLVERFQRAHQAGGGDPLAEHEADDADEDEARPLDDEDEDLEDVDDLGREHG